MMLSRPNSDSISLPGLRARRDELVGRVTALSPHSFRRFALEALLAEITRQILALELSSPPIGAGPDEGLPEKWFQK